MSSAPSPQRKKKEFVDDVVKEPELPDFTSTFKPRNEKSLPNSGWTESKSNEPTSFDQLSGRDDAGPIPDADEATAAKSNKELEKKMLESMKKM